jgi:mono/diheme cytochrome c family protein
MCRRLLVVGMVTIPRVHQPAAPHESRKLRTFAFITLIGSLGFGILAAAPSISAQTPAAARTGPVTIWDGVYTAAQARRGEQVFKTQCSYCHKEDLSGGFFDDGLGRAPALAGKRAFDSSLIERWGGMTLADMVGTVAATMPEPRPSSLTVENYVDVVSYLLSKNDVPAGATDLPGDVEALGQIQIVAGKRQP